MEFEYCHLTPRATPVVVEDLSKPYPLESLQLQKVRADYDETTEKDEKGCMRKGNLLKRKQWGFQENKRR